MNHGLSRYPQSSCPTNRPARVGAGAFVFGTKYTPTSAAAAERAELSESVNVRISCCSSTLSETIGNGPRGPMDTSASEHVLRPPTRYGYARANTEAFGARTLMSWYTCFTAALTAPSMKGG